ncbi:amino acid ABC transporter permease [Pseudokineococcus lusitanus]|uniref:Glutamate transport system permease protein n=1 Tax=Pseudokineococcus lusitanus TaxID=763993 RepID=A0A3N1HT36_9ACTN|nr:amino acid ABC transporter permease [Pseudokineococcus lusitanus]ROP45683.1 glutamate transport system permease protein [Pseudokineococcus lusitanus]
MSAPTSVLYDLPGPKAVRRNRVIGVVGVLLVIGLVAFFVYRMGEAGQLTAARWTPFLYSDIQNALLDGLLATLQVAAIAGALALAFGVVFAAGQLSDHRVLRWPSVAVVQLFRGLPLLLLIFALFFASGGAITVFWSLVLGLVLYNGSVLAEVFRAGVLAVPRGQWEAASALGLRKTATMRLVLVPQAVRSMLPVIVAQLVVLLKDSALGFIVGYTELLRQGRLIGTNFFNVIPSLLVVAVIYIVINFLLGLLATYLERRLSRSKRSSADTHAPEVELEQR